MRLLALNRILYQDRQYRQNDIIEVPDNCGLATLARIERLAAAGLVRHLGETQPMSTASAAPLVIEKRASPPKARR